MNYVKIHSDAFPIRISDSKLDWLYFRDSVLFYPLKNDNLIDKISKWMATFLLECSFGSDRHFKIIFLRMKCIRLSSMYNTAILSKLIQEVLKKVFSILYNRKKLIIREGFKKVFTWLNIEKETALLSWPEKDQIMEKVWTLKIWLFKFHD